MIIENSQRRIMDYVASEKYWTQKFSWVNATLTRLIKIRSAGATRHPSRIWWRSEVRVTQETFTVLPDSTLREVSLLLAGMRITLTTEETRRLVSALAKGLQTLGVSESRVLGDGKDDRAVHDFASELRNVKDELKHTPPMPRTA
jgi:hypothetical protein